METTASATRRGIAIGLVLALMAAAMWTVNETRAEAVSPAPAAATPLLAQVGDNPDSPPLSYEGGWFAKYDGIDGESNDATHNNWIDFVAYQWGMEVAGATTGATRRRGAPTIDAFVLTFEYEKAATKMLDKCLKGEIIPKLEVELTTATEAGRQTYLRYEMKNVACQVYDVGGYADGTRPMVSIAHLFEEIKVTYSEYDDDGNKAGDVETVWKVEKGT